MLDSENGASLLLLLASLLPLKDGLKGLAERDLLVTGLRGLGLGVVVVVVVVEVVVLGVDALLLVKTLLVDLSRPPNRFLFLDPNGPFGVEASEASVELTVLGEVTAVVEVVEVSLVVEGVEESVVIA